MSKETKLLSGHPINHFELSRYSTEMLKAQAESASKKAVKGDKAAQEYYRAIVRELDQRARAKGSMIKASKTSSIFKWPKAPSFKK